MSVKRIVNTGFWESPKVIDRFSVEDKYFMLYLLTNPKTTQLGIYKLPLKIISFQTGYTTESVTVLIERFERKYNNIIYDTRFQEIAILNSLKYSIVKGGKPVSDLLIKELAAIKSTKLIKEVYKKMLSWWDLSNREFDKTVKDLFEKEINKRYKIDDNDNDNDDSYHDSYHDSLKEPKCDDDVTRHSKETTEDFDLFWQAYPKKVSKGQAIKTFNKVVKDEETLNLILCDLEKRKNYTGWLKENGQFIPYPSTYLNNTGWEDEYDIDVVDCPL